MKRTLLSKRIALTLAFLLFGTVLPFTGSAETGGSKQVTMTYAYTNDSGATTDANKATDVTRTIDGNENNYYQPAANVDGLYVVYNLEESAAVNHLRIKINATFITGITFSLYYTSQEYTEAQNDAEISWVPVLENAAPYTTMPEDFGFDTVQAKQMKLVVNNKNTRPVIYEISLSYAPFKTSYHVDAVNHTITNIPLAESDIATVKNNISADNGYQYTIYSNFEGVGDPSNIERTEGNISGTDELIVSDSTGNFVEQYTFLPGSESVILRSDVLADNRLQGNAQAFSINLSGFFIYQVPKSYTASKLLSVLKMDYPGTITVLTNQSQPIEGDEIAANYRVRVKPENGIGSKDYIISTIASSYNTSAAVTPSSDVLYWDDAQTTFWVSDGMTAEDLWQETGKPAGGSVIIQNAGGEAVTSGPLTTGMKLVSTAESGDADSLTEPETRVYPIMVDYALQKTASSTTKYYDSATPEYAVDGIKTIGYKRYLGLAATEGDVTIDLGTGKTIDTVSLRLQNPNTSEKVLPDQFKVLVSNDNLTFSEVCSYGTQGTALDNETDLFAVFQPIEARYVKLLITNNSVIPENFGKAAIRISNVSVFDCGIRTSADISLWQNDVSIESIATGDVTAKVALTAESNITGVTFQTSANLILATYKGNQLTNVLIKPLVLTAGSTETTASETISVEAEDTEVKAFLWTSVTDDIKPLCAGKSASRNAGE